MYLKNLIMATTLIAILPNPIVTVQVDPNIGSNWYVPTPSSTPPLEKTSVSENAGLSYNYNTVLNTDQSSFLPTSNFLSTNQASTVMENINNNNNNNNGANYYNLQQQQTTAGDSMGKPYQYLQYHPEGSSFHIYPVASSAEGLAEQRQEFLNPNINGLLPLGGDSVNVDGGDGGGSIFDNLPSFGGMMAGGITGTASNIAQSIGLGGLGLLGSVIVLAIGGPLILFAILFPAAILVIAILGFPVLQLTLPASDPNLGRKLKSGVMDAARKAKEVLQSEECVERFSCVLARKSRTLPYENWILEKMEKISNSWANRVSKSVKFGRAGESCQQFKCSPVTKLKTVYDAFASSTAKYLAKSDELRA